MWIAIEFGGQREDPSTIVGIFESKELAIEELVRAADLNGVKTIEDLGDVVNISQKKPGFAGQVSKITLNDLAFIQV